MELRAEPGSSKEEKQSLALTLHLHIVVIVSMLSCPSWLMKVRQELLLLMMMFGVCLVKNNTDDNKERGM